MSLSPLLSGYAYDLPPELVAKTPAHPRDSARLLVFDRVSGLTRLSTFQNILEFLPKNAVLVLNETKVIPARMTLKKPTGGVVDALLIGLGKEETGTLRVLATGHLTANTILHWQGDHFFTVKEREGKIALLQPSFPLTELSHLLQEYGETPLPPYLADSPLSEHERREEYQTVFARAEGSVAAPTAGLHFTPALLKQIEAAGITIARVTLHVNLGTFAPLTEEQLATRTLHEEHYEIDPATAAMLTQAKASKRPVIAVGTTVVRALESAWKDGKITPGAGSTTLFLSPDSPPRFVDHLITNFHVPRSSLLLLVASFTGRDALMQLYAQAIDARMRFFSFGDGMLVL